MDISTHSICSFHGKSTGEHGVSHQIYQNGGPGGPLNGHQGEGFSTLNRLNHDVLGCPNDHTNPHELATGLCGMCIYICYIYICVIVIYIYTYQGLRFRRFQTRLKELDARRWQKILHGFKRTWMPNFFKHCQRLQTWDASGWAKLCRPSENKCSIDRLDSIRLH